MTNNDTTLQLSSVLNRECTRSRVHCQSKKRALEIISELAAKKDSLSPEVLAEAQRMHREGQFYWDFVMVENSEGAHNPELTNAILDKAEAAIDNGFALIG